MRRFSFLAVLAVSFIVSGVAVAQVQPRPEPQVQEPRQGREGREGRKGMILDADKDGRISRDEWQRNAVFDRLDANRDGFLTEDEFRTHARKQGGAGPDRMGPKRMDENGDGQISKSEWKGQPERFTSLDANGDGVLTRDEFRKKSRK
jgi:Ca2+-binding EF-hand superfamily protein